MIHPTRRTATDADFTRRRFAQLAVLGIAAGAAPIAASTPASASASAPASASTPAPASASVSTPSASASAGPPSASRPHYDRARRLAGDDPVLRALVTALTPGSDLPDLPAPAPVKLFDNLVLLSAGWVSAMAVLTDDGIVLIDALTSPADADNIIVPGLRAVGADPAAIKHVVLTHGHSTTSAARRPSPTATAPACTCPRPTGTSSPAPARPTPPPGTSTSRTASS